jgi:hypothetical protein
MDTLSKGERQRKRAALRGAGIGPRVGVGAESVMNMRALDLPALLALHGRKQVQQQGRIHTAAVAEQQTRSRRELPGERLRQPGKQIRRLPVP